VTALLAGVLAAANGTAAAEEPRVPIRDPEHEFQARIPSWKELQQRNVVMQKREYSCGAASMATLLRYYWGDAVTEEEVLTTLTKLLTPEELKDRIKNGLAFSDLRRTAVKMGYEATIGTLPFDKLVASRAPLVIPLRLKKFDHFVVFRGVVDGRVYLADPVRGNVRPTISEFREQWQKEAVLVIAKPDVEPPKTSPLSIRPEEVHFSDLTRQTIGRQLPEPGLSPRTF
jgi:predicted double-glycine peptidase